MTASAPTVASNQPNDGEPQLLDALLVGAGVNGMYMLYRLRELGLSVQGIEAGGGVGGTWHWNRYPGARLDSESYTYGYFFSEEIQKNWSWSEEFAGQPELQRYFDFVADTLDLRKDILFNTKVTAAAYDEVTHIWNVTTDTGRTFRTRYLLLAAGFLSAPQFPPVPGIDRFQGESFHTGLWPESPVDFTGKRVAVVGTGASGVQVIATIAQDVKSLTVFQRTPNWCTPINNRPITPARSRELQDGYRELYAKLQATKQGFIHDPRQQSGMDVPAAERLQFFQDLWEMPGLSLYQANFEDLLIDRELNAELSAFIAQKIQDRVHDPVVADRLIPHDHGFAMKRPPLETNYYEVYNKDNVELVPLAEEPIEEITETGIRTSKRFIEVDVIVYATGFDAVTGAIRRIDITGVGGKALKDYWDAGPKSMLGIGVVGFPNLLLVGGPHSAAGNNPRIVEQQVDWIAGLLRYMREHDTNLVTVTPEAEGDWTAHANSTIEGTLQAGANSWYFGSNVPGKARSYLLYAGGQPAYRAWLKRIVDEDYRGFVFEHVEELPSVAPVA
jgi:cation diffusion facilitator CzcD-associated flavoprotein CzcO